MAENGVEVFTKLPPMNDPEPSMSVCEVNMIVRDGKRISFYDDRGQMPQLVDVQTQSLLQRLRISSIDWVDMFSDESPLDHFAGFKKSEGYRLYCGLFNSVMPEGFPGVVGMIYRSDKGFSFTVFENRYSFLTEYLSIRKCVKACEKFSKYPCHYRLTASSLKQLKYLQSFYPEVANCSGRDATILISLAKMKSQLTVIEQEKTFRKMLLHFNC
jgi:hypothetical protein